MTIDKGAHWERFQRLRRQNQRQLARHDWSDAGFKVFVYPVSRVISDFERDAFLGTRMLYAEDYAHYYLYKYLFRHCVGTDDPDEADYFFLPILFPPFDIQDVDLTQTVERLEFLGRKPHLMFTSWDTYPRPLPVRANPFDCIDENNDTGVVRDEYNTTKMGWLDERFIVLAHESSIDLLPRDIGVFPVQASKQHSPAGPRELLFSFKGCVVYGDLADDHVRGRANHAHWKRLIATSGDEHQVIDVDTDEAKMSLRVDYGDLARRSVFTLCPAGWARWSYRVSEAMHAGSIPVLLSDYYQKPFSDQIPWDHFSLTLPEAALPRIDRILRHLSPEKVAWLQRGVKRYQKLFTPTGIGRLVVDELARRAAQ